jgi:rhamnosyltransferase
MGKKVSVLIPLYNGEKSIRSLLTMLLKQKINIDDSIEIIAVDSSSTDKTIEIITNEFPEVKVSSIPNKMFDHGGTRNFLASQATGDFLLYMTQDAIPYDENLINELINGFEDNNVQICFARQVPYNDAGPLEQFARKFNYPNHSIIKDKSRLKELGIKTFFNSNVCSMYKKETFEKYNGFPEKIILNEDMIFASKVILGGGKVLYSAKAKVYHSHNYTLIQQFKRYFDIGMAFNETKYLLDEVSNEKEGMKFLNKLINNLLKSKLIHLVPIALIETLIKFIGYNLGKKHSLIPIPLKRKISAYMK